MRLFALLKHRKEYKKLRAIDPSSVPVLPRAGKKIWARVVSVYDGDTITVVLNLNKSTPIRLRLRLSGVDTPEIRSRNRLHRDAGIVARDALVKILNFQENTPCMIHAILHKWDKYGGRVVSTIYSGDRCVNVWLIANGYAHPYNGSKKVRWTDEELQGIVDRVTE